MDKPTCAVETCGRPVYARGWCLAHYGRWKDHRDVNPSRPINERRFRSETVGDRKRCTYCGEFKPFDQFNRRARSLDGRSARCAACGRLYWEATKDQRRAAHQEWVKANQEHLRAYRRATKKRDDAWRAANRERVRQWANERNRKLRDEVLAAYGGICACCGETERAFLQIDHINGDGAAHRRTLKRVKLDAWLRQNGYPPGFQVLCCNCNFGRHLNSGICPHLQRVGEVVKTT